MHAPPTNKQTINVNKDSDGQLWWYTSVNRESGEAWATQEQLVLKQGRGVGREVKGVSQELARVLI